MLRSRVHVAQLRRQREGLHEVALLFCAHLRVCVSLPERNACGCTCMYVYMYTHTPFIHISMYMMCLCLSLMRQLTEPRRWQCEASFPPLSEALPTHRPLLPPQNLSSSIANTYGPNCHEWFRTLRRSELPASTSGLAKTRGHHFCSY